MKIEGIPVAAAALLCVSCTHQVQTATQGASRTAVAAVMTRQVQNAIDAGDGDLEMRGLRQRLATNANDLDARMAMARLYSRRGLPDLALEHYRLAAIQFPDSVPAALALAKSLRDLAGPAASLAAVEDFLARHPNGSWELLSLQGILEEAQEQLEPAEAAHRAALTLAPDRSALHNNLGYNLLLQGKANAAMTEFRRALELDPRSEIAHNNLGAALALQSQPLRALALNELEHAADPAVAHNNLAAVLIEQGRYSEARGELETALEIRRDFSAALANLNLVAAMDGKPVTVPAVRRPVNFWRRTASALSWVAIGPPAPKPPPTGANAASGSLTNVAGKD